MARVRPGTGCRRSAADGADEDGDQHGGGQALSGDIADDEEQPAAGVGQDLEEVAADLLGGLVDGFDAEAGDGFNLLGEDHLLDFAGGGEFAFKDGLLLAHAGGAEDHDDGQGGEVKQVGQVADAELKGASRVPEEKLVSVVGGGDEGGNQCHEKEHDLGIKVEALQDDRNEEDAGLAVASAPVDDEQDRQDAGDENDQREECKDGAMREMEPWVCP